jgi:hypothetical protein
MVETAMAEIGEGGRQAGRKWNPMWMWAAFAVLVVIVVGTSFVFFGFEEQRTASDASPAVTRQVDGPSGRL